jgi:RNA polymerase sigma factor (sigma-70 family)
VSELDDAEIIADFLQTRDPERFRLLVERHQQNVFRLVLSVLGPYTDADAEEITQEVFLRVFEKLEQWRGNAKFSTWLYRVAYNSALNKKALARFRFEHISTEDLFETADAENVSAELSRKRQREIVARCLEALPPIYSFTIYAHYWLGHSVDEIGRYLDAPPNTVKSYLARGRQRLGLLLAKEGITCFE